MIDSGQPFQLMMIIVVVVVQDEDNIPLVVITDSTSRDTRALWFCASRPIRVCHCFFLRQLSRLDVIRHVQPNGARAQHERRRRYPLSSAQCYDGKKKWKIRARVALLDVERNVRLHYQSSSASASSVVLLVGGAPRRDGCFEHLAVLVDALCSSRLADLCVA